MDSQTTFDDALFAALMEHAAPHFAEAARYAEANGLEAQVQLPNAQLSELRLTLKRPSDGALCAYRIGALGEADLVVHEKTFDRRVQRLEAPLASINQTLVETELAAFFIKAAALPLDYVSSRHQPGFI